MDNENIWILLTFLIPAIIGIIFLILDSKFLSKEVK